MKSLKQLREDRRIGEIEKVIEDDRTFYIMSLKNGYVFDDGTALQVVDTVSELNELVKEIVVGEVGGI